MVRVLNFCSFALAALCCLGLYHVSEQTRVARFRLLSVEKQITDDHGAMKVLEADWERVSEPSHIQALAQARLGLSDSAAVSMASLELLPRRGDTGAPVQAASAIASAPPPDARLHLVSAHAGN
jgi:hypothetical protein